MNAASTLEGRCQPPWLRRAHVCSITDTPVRAALGRARRIKERAGGRPGRGAEITSSDRTGNVPGSTPLSEKEGGDAGISWACVMTAANLPVRSTLAGTRPTYSFLSGRPVSWEAGSSPSAASAQPADSRTRLQGQTHPGKAESEQLCSPVLKRGRGHKRLGRSDAGTSPRRPKCTCGV